MSIKIDSVFAQIQMRESTNAMLAHLTERTVDFFSQDFAGNTTAKVHFYVIVNGHFRYADCISISISSISSTDKKKVIRQALLDKKEFWRGVINSLGIVNGSRVMFYMQGVPSITGTGVILLDAICEKDKVGLFESSTHHSTARHYFATLVESQIYMHQRLSKLTIPSDCMPLLK